jgi:hypothetical protein
MIASVKVQNAPRQASQMEVQDVPQTKTFQSKGQHSSVSPKDLSKRWQNGLEQGKETLKKTTQQMVRSAVMPLARLYRADSVFHKKLTRGMWASDTMDGRVKLLDGNHYAQVFSNSNFFANVYPMARKADAGMALREFVLEYGSPDDLTIDGSKEQHAKGTEFIKIRQQNDVKVTRREPEHPYQKSAEGVICEVRRRWFCTMIRKRVPLKLWDYGVRWTAQVMQRTLTQTGSLHGECPLWEVTGKTLDISEYLVS